MLIIVNIKDSSSKYLFRKFAIAGDFFDKGTTIPAFIFLSSPTSHGLNVIFKKTHLKASFASCLYFAENIPIIENTISAIKQATISKSLDAQI